MSGEYIEYQTQERDRWDTVAWKNYGDPYAYEVILRANPEVSPTPELAGGIVLKVPILEVTTETPQWAPWQS